MQLFPSGDRIAAVWIDQSYREIEMGVWDLSTKQRTCTFQPLRGMRPYSVEILIFPSEDRIAVVANGNRAEVWDLTTQQRLVRFPGRIFMRSLLAGR